MAYAPVIRTLVLEAHRYLAGLDSSLKGIPDVLAGLQRWELGPINAIAAQPVPICGCLDAALALAEEQGAASVTRAIVAARPHLCWVTYDLYPRAEIGDRFPEAHAFASLIGPAGFIPASDFELGIFLIAPRTLYRDHRHKAPELYAPLTGPTQWRFGPDSPWMKHQAHEPVWNESMAIHATRVGAAPLLCFYVWTRDIADPAQVVAAPDWQEIESSL